MNNQFNQIRVFVSSPIVLTYKLTILFAYFVPTSSRVCITVD